MANKSQGRKSAYASHAKRQSGSQPKKKKKSKISWQYWIIVGVMLIAMGARVLRVLLR